MANMLSLPQGMEITAAIEPGFETILSPEALALVANSSRAGANFWSSARRAPSAWTRVSARTSWPRPGPCVKEIGRLRRCLRIWRAGVSKSRAPSSAR